MAFSRKIVCGKAKIRRKAGAFQGFSTRQRAIFSEKAARIPMNTGSKSLFRIFLRASFLHLFVPFWFVVLAWRQPGGVRRAKNPSKSYKKPVHNKILNRL